MTVVPTTIVEFQIDGSLLSLDDHTLKLSDAAPVRHALGGDELFDLVKEQIPKKAYVVYSITNDNGARTYRLEWAAKNGNGEFEYYE